MHVQQLLQVVGYMLILGAGAPASAHFWEHVSTWCRCTSFCTFLGKCYHLVQVHQVLHISVDILTLVTGAPASAHFRVHVNTCHRCTSFCGAFTSGKLWISVLNVWCRWTCFWSFMGTDTLQINTTWKWNCFSSFIYKLYTCQLTLNDHVESICEQPSKRNYPGWPDLYCPFNG